MHWARRRHPRLHDRLGSATALDRPLGLHEGVTPEQLRAAAEGHVVAHGTLVGVVAR